MSTTPNQSALGGRFRAGWANGWIVPPDSTDSTDYRLPITIIFWPQYLEFLGFGLLTAGFLFILFYRPKIDVDGKNN